MLITEELTCQNSSALKANKIKAKEPDTFNGSDPCKLNNFILLCNLHFRRSSAYNTDDAKITFAISYLHGTALEYFEPELLNPNSSPDWVDDWAEFVSTL